MHLFQATWGQNDKFSTTLLNKCTCLKIGWDIGPENWLENWPENWPGKFARKLAQKINWKMVRKSSKTNVGKWPENLPKTTKWQTQIRKMARHARAITIQSRLWPAMASHGQPWPAMAAHGCRAHGTQRPNTVQDQTTQHRPRP